jgi:hypothetical protein
MERQYLIVGNHYFLADLDLPSEEAVLEIEYLRQFRGKSMFQVHSGNEWRGEISVELGVLKHVKVTKEEAQAVYDEYYKAIQDQTADQTGLVTYLVDKLKSLMVRTEYASPFSIGEAKLINDALKREFGINAGIRGWKT